MHDCATPPDCESVFQPKLRPDDHEHTSAFAAQDTNGSQEKVAFDTSLLLGRVHNTLRNLVKAFVIHSAIQRRMGFLVLS